MTSKTDNTTDSNNESSNLSFGDFGMLLNEIPVGDNDALSGFVGDLREYRDSLGDPSIAVVRFIDKAVSCLEAVIANGTDWETSISTAFKLLDAAAFLPSGDTPENTPATDMPESSDQQSMSEAVLPVDSETQEATSSPSSSIEDDTTEYSTPEFDADDQELVSEFVNESTEYLDEAESALLVLEEHPEDIDTIDTIFRCFHTIKGVAAFLGFGAVAALSHRAESLLSRARDKEIRLTGGYATLALQSVDNLKAFIENIREGEMGKLPPTFRRLMGILVNPDAHVSSESGIANRPSSEAENSVQQTEDIVDLAEVETSSPKSETLAEPSAVTSSPLPTKAVGPQPAKPEKTSEPTGAKSGEPTGAKPGKANSAKVEATVRVRTDRLDRLIDAVGELVIAQSMVAEDPNSHKIGLQKKVVHAGKIIRDLQDMTLALRMVPLKATMQKMSRVVRDVARKQNKRVELVTEGAETEIDRGMVDVISDPLVHMVRNSVDHGIESEADRVAAGKPPVGQVKLTAKHSQGSVVVSLIDDGKGLDRRKIAAKAISQGLIESDEGMSDSDVFRLIFSAGFSTAEVVTDVSGRGVGMDVVRRAIESLKGSVEIRSELGEGTTFDIRLPLTLAITDGMLVKVGAQRYIIPTVNIVRSLRPISKDLSRVTGRGELVSLRGEQVPIYRLHEIYDVDEAEQDPTKALLVFVSEGDRMAAILVDSLLGKQQVVTKSLGEGVGKIPGVSGGAILGDGRVGLILDPNTLVAFARESGRTQRRPLLTRTSQSAQIAV